MEIDKVGIIKKERESSTHSKRERRQEDGKGGKKTKRVGNGHSREWDIVDFLVHDKGRSGSGSV